jgi:hypothetical protein
MNFYKNFFFLKKMNLTITYVCNISYVRSSRAGLADEIKQKKKKSNQKYLFCGVGTQLTKP